MAISSHSPPEPVTQVVRDGVSRLLAAGAGRELAVMGGATARTTSLTAPHRSFVLELKDVARSRGLSAARPTGWRFLIRDGDNFVGIGESADALDGGASRFSKLDPASRAETIALALRRAESQVGDRDDFELRYLRIPSLFINAIWLHGLNRDFLLPTEGQSSEGDEPVDASGFLRALAPRARERLAVDDGELGG